MEPAIFRLDEDKFLVVEVMLERHRSVVSFLDKYPFLCDSTNPFSKLHDVLDCGRKHDYSDVVGQHDDTLFPYNSSFLVVDVVDLVEYDPFYVLDGVGSSIKHVSQYLCGHNQAGSVWLQVYVTCYDSDISKLLLEVPVLLVAQSFDRTCIDRL